MAEESMLSTAESGIEPPPGAAAGAGAQAEMITKKLANYWCLIGSIPLVMFLLVAIPTIFYVKKFSEYVNAEYCESKSCKDLADAILKAGPISQACTKFSAHVCAAKVDFTTLALKKLFDENSKDPPEGAQPPPGISEWGKAKAYLLACTGAELSDDLEPFYATDLGHRIDKTGALEAARLSGYMSAVGIDGLVRAVAFVGNTSGNQAMKPSVELSAPVNDFYVRMLLAASEKGYAEVMNTLGTPGDDDFPVAQVDAARKSLDTFILSKAKTSRQTRPKVMTYGELKNLDGDEFKWQLYLKEISDVTQDAFPDDTEIRLVHPKYLLGLDTFIKEAKDKLDTFVSFLNTVVMLEACVYAYGRLCFKSITKNKEAYCLLHTDRMFPGVLGHHTFYTRATQFGAPTGINPGGVNSSAMAAFLDAQVRQMLDSMAFSYSLSTSATEENRIAFYHKTLNVTVAPGFFNNTDGLTDAETKLLTEKVVASDTSDVYSMTSQAIDSFKAAYWPGVKNMTTTFLKFRNRYHPLYATFTATEDHLYVPMGVFTTPIFRNSQKNRIFYGTASYLVMTGMMKAMSLTDAMVVKGQLVPENWIGYSWTRKIERFAECIGRPTNDTMDVFTDPYMLGAVTPAFRFYRRKIFEKAYPRPEFRVDWVSDLSSTQLFFYSWAMLHCGTKQGQELIDLATKNNFYFLDSFKCEAGLKAYAAKPCDLWNTTRRDY